jgi:hypothetical protein
MKRLLVTAVAALFASPAFSAIWVQVNEKGDVATAYVDISSIRGTGDLVQAWSKLVVKRPGADHIATLVQNMAYNCSAHSQARVSYVSYRYDHRVLDTVTEPQVIFVDAAPDTVADALTTYVCDYRK